jgi:hypothetical protein
VTKYANEKLKWRVSGRRHLIRSSVLILAGPLLGLVVAGLLLPIDHTDTAAHLNTAQDVVGTSALVLGCALAAACIVPGIRRLRRVAVGGTDDLLVITSKRRFAIPLSTISNVSVASPTSKPSVHLPGVVLTNGVFVGIPDGQSKNECGDTGVIDVDDVSRRPRDLDHAWSVALEARRNLTTLAPRPTPTLVISPSVNLENHTKKVDNPPSGAIVKITRREIRTKRTYLILAPSLILPIFYGFQVQSTSDHAFNAAQFAIVVFALEVLVAILTGIPIALLIAEMQIGPDWIATRRNFSSKWSVFYRSTIIGIAALQPRQKRPIKNARATLDIVDSSGRRMTLPSTWLTDAATRQLIAAFGELPIWGSGVKEKLVSPVSPS